MLFATCAVAALASQWCGAAGTAADWLVTGCAIRSSVVAAPRGDDGSVAVTLSNGVVSRTLIANASTGLAATTSFSMLGEELLRTDVLAPEVLLAVNGVGVVVGGDAAPASDTRPRARFAGFRAPLPPLAGGFHWVPGSRGSDPNGAWPPRGVAAEFDHALGCAAVGAGPTGTIVATVRMELYDETSAFGRRVRLAHNCSAPLYVGNLSVSVYLPAHDRAITTATDASVAAVRLLPDPARAGVRYYTNGHISTPGLRDFGPGLSDWRGGGGGSGGGYESYFVAEVAHDVPFDPAPPQRGFGRYGLADARAARVLAPQTEQAPIRVGGVCVGGRAVPPPDGVGGSAGSWCYDEEGRNGTLSLLRQCASAGVEIFTFPQNMNGTWRAFVGNEFASAANVSWLRATVGVAHAAGIEVGTYQLLLNARSATALNQAAPPDAATLPNRGFDCMDPGTRLTCHNHGRAGCAGGPGCCAMCGATDFYSGLEASVLAWWRATGVSATNQDGAESATPCANESHAHHHGLNDSLWTQYQAVRRTFHGYLTAPAAAYAANATAANATAVPPPVGFIVGMPGSVFEAGQAKVPGGYSEELYSLPRWTWIDATRASIIFDSAHGRDLAVPIGRRMFPFPLSAPYHPSEPDPAQPGRWRAVAGYDSAATLSPLEAHVPELEWALSAVFGTGASAELRGRKLWDGPRSEAALRKWVGWAKRYRRVLSAESATIAHGTSCWGKAPLLPNSTCALRGLDAIVHRAPQHFYPDIVERALAVVWNPTNGTIAATLQAPLYYAGLSRARGTSAVQLSREGGAPASVPLGVNDSVPLAVDLAPRALTWFVITE